MKRPQPVAVAAIHGCGPSREQRLPVEVATQVISVPLQRLRQLDSAGIVFVPPACPSMQATTDHHGDEAIPKEIRTQAVTRADGEVEVVGAAGFEPATPRL